MGSLCGRAGEGLVGVAAKAANLLSPLCSTHVSEETIVATVAVVKEDSVCGLFFPLLGHLFFFLYNTKDNVAGLKTGSEVKVENKVKF